MEEYPISSGSKRLKEVLELLYGKIQDSIQNDTFIPLYSKDAIESPTTGCSAFLDRQFWRSVKFIRSVMCFRYVLSDSCLEELIVEGIVNRSTVLALQVSILSDESITTKCLAVINEIPQEWLPPIRHSSYRSLTMLLTQVLNEHRQIDREFSRHAQRFIGMTQKMIKNEELE